LRNLRHDYSKDRKFFVGPSGRMGLRPASMQGDDLVVILKGSKNAFVLRRLAGEYHLTGTVYVYGSMYRQAMQEHKALQESEMVISIR
jgi:hypothetical protein